MRNALRLVALEPPGDGRFDATWANVPTARECGYRRTMSVTSSTGLHGDIGRSNHAVAGSDAPEERSPFVGFLAFEQAGYITGVVVPVDGGLSM